jgi:hypothetical protein
MSPRIEPDREELARFIDALFVHASDGGKVLLRAFFDDDLAKKRNDPPFRTVTATINGEGPGAILEPAYKVAYEAAREERPVVVCPPIATFTRAKADEASLREGLALSVELDEGAQASVASLRQVIGKPTLVLESGGEWADPELGEMQSKLHVHWRLKEPTQAPEEHARLKRARALACELVGADGSAKPIVHPLRWAGTVHRKNPAAPRLARIVEGNPEAEIILEDALAELEGLAALRGVSGREHKPGVSPTADGDLLLACAERIENRDRQWADWNRFGLAFWRASGGSEAGFQAFDAFSRKSRKYDPDATQARWRHYGTSPPSSIGIGTLIREAQQVDSSFMRPPPGEYDGPASRDELLPPKEEPRKRQKPKGQTSSLAEKSLLRIEAGKLTEITNRSAKILGAATLADPFTGIYRRGNLLVRPARVQEESELRQRKVKRPPGQLVIVEVDLDYLVVALGQCIRWEKFDKRSEKWVPSDPPLLVAKSLKAAHDRMRSIPYLAGIVEAPTLRRDGSVLDKPGYDEETGLLFDPGDTVFPPVPSRPTRDQALAARDRLLTLLAKFTFVDEASKSVTIASYITAVIRKGMRTAPLLTQSATMMSSGKTLLNMLAGYIATGREPPMMSQAENASEDRKRLLAMLVEGAPVNVIDNVEDPLRSATLAAILTAKQYKDRWLGVSKNVTAPTDVTILANGNNLVVEGDLSTRTLKSSLDPGVERPEERDFDLNLHEHVPANRGQLSVDCITIVRAYIAAGEPMHRKITNYARFEDWSRRVREPLIWLDMSDPCQTRKSVEESDTRRSELVQLLTAWNENYPGESATVGEAAKRATREPLHSHGQKEPEADTECRQRLADALREVGDKKGGGIDSQAVGHFIRANEGTRRNGMRFVKVGVAHSVSRWKVEHEKRGD